AEAIAPDDDVIEALGIEADEGYSAGGAELVEHAVDGLALPAAEDVVHLGAEAERAHRERVGVAAGHVVRLEDQDAPAGTGEQRRHGEAAEAGADHQIVEVVHGAPAWRDLRRIPRRKR